MKAPLVAHQKSKENLLMQGSANYMVTSLYTFILTMFGLRCCKTHRISKCNIKLFSQSRAELTDYSLSSTRKLKMVIGSLTVLPCADRKPFT
jgi:hypothetical protein